MVLPSATALQRKESFTTGSFPVAQFDSSQKPLAAIGTPMLTAKTSASLKNVVIHFMAVPPFTLDLVTHVSDGLSPVLVPPLAPVSALGLPGLSV